MNTTPELRFQPPHTDEQNSKTYELTNKLTVFIPQSNGRKFKYAYVAKQKQTHLNNQHLKPDSNHSITISLTTVVKSNIKSHGMIMTAIVTSIGASVRQGLDVGNDVALRNHLKVTFGLAAVNDGIVGGRHGAIIILKIGDAGDDGTRAPSNFGVRTARAVAQHRVGGRVISAVSRR